MKHRMRRLPASLPIVVAAVVIAGCSSQPAMNSAVVSQIHNGGIVIIMPPGRIFSPPRNNINPGWGLGMSIFWGGAVGVLLYEALESSSPPTPNSNAQKIVDQYKKLMSAVPVGKDFVKSVTTTGERVPWVRSPVTEYREPADGGNMRHMAKRAKSGVVAFIRPWVHFSSSLRKVALAVYIHVYSRGPDGQAFFLSGGTVHVSTDMADTGAPLKHVGVEGIAASDINDSAALGARANLWFEKRDARFKQAISMDMKKAQTVLANYLNGRRDAN
ncbi:MAG: hypothetical protein ACRES9_01680 [Gammaproteobacteria bacterium]